MLDNLARYTQNSEILFQKISFPFDTSPGIFEWNEPHVCSIFQNVFVVSDSSGENETVEVGVIVIGLCCICLVACALVVLQLRSNSSRTTGSRRQRPENSGDGSGDRTRDPLDLEAPPSYDAGMLLEWLCARVCIITTATDWKHRILKLYLSRMRSTTAVALVFYSLALMQPF